MDDKESLIRAFKGAHVIFSNTDFFTHAIHGLNPGNLPEGRTTLEYAYDREVAQGFNIAAAAAAPSVIETLERFVMSTLSNATKRSNGKYTGVYHFDTKSEIIRLIQERCPTVASRLSTVTVGHYATIWKFTPALAPQLQPDGSYLLARNSPADFKWPLVVTHQDTGGFVKALVDLPSNKHIFAVSQYMTFPEFMKTWGSVHGVKAEYTRISREEMFQSLPESLGTEMGDSFDFIHEFGYTARDPSVLSAEEVT